MKKPFFLLLLISILNPISAEALGVEVYQKRPKLVLILVIDQFRADLLARFEGKFLPAKNGGFQRLIAGGALFPAAQYDSLQAMTGPNHATIVTGARPHFHGIGTNEWFDPIKMKKVYCVDDEKFGVSPLRLRAPSLGDELRLVRPESKVVAIALKDRSSILMGGRNPSVAIWWNAEKSAWGSSTYYREPLPGWLQTLNGSFSFNARNPAPLAQNLTSSLTGTNLTVEAALAAVEGEKLGQAKDRMDFLAVSFSSHDTLGHAIGPSDPKMEELTLAEDRALADLLKRLEKKLGSLDDVLIALTADHGVAPLVETAQKVGLDTGRLDPAALSERMERALRKKFGNPNSGNWILGTLLFHFFLNQKELALKGIDPVQAEEVARANLETAPGVQLVFTRGDFKKKMFPTGIIGEQIKVSYLPEQSGDLVLVPRPFFYELDSYPAIHMTGWTYDRAVPLLLFGRAIRKGVYPGGGVIDLAPTLAFLMGILPPAMSEGRVLGEALK